MPRKPGPRASLRSRWLGEMLREMRKDQKIYLADAAEFIQRDQGMLSRYESGKYPIRKPEVQALMDFYGVSEEETRASLLKLCDEVWKTGWWDRHSDELGSNFINVPWLESQAQKVCSYQNMLVDGLLQTRNYAKALIEYFAEPDTLDEHINKLVDIRMQRAQILTADQPTSISTVVEESVLRSDMGSRDIQLEQLNYLLEQANRENVEVRVMGMETGLHGGIDGSFYLYDMPPEFPEIALASSQGGSLYIEEPEVEKLHKRWGDIVRGAHTIEKSKVIIEMIIEEKNERS